jgi:hypothetical protein
MMSLLAFEPGQNKANPYLHETTVNTTRRLVTSERVRAVDDHYELRMLLPCCGL